MRSFLSFIIFVLGFLQVAYGADIRLDNRGDAYIKQLGKFIHEDYYLFLRPDFKRDYERQRFSCNKMFCFYAQPDKLPGWFRYKPRLWDLHQSNHSSVTYQQLGGLYEEVVYWVNRAVI